MIDNLSTVVPLITVTSAVCGFLGWSMRGPGVKALPAKATKTAPVADKGQQDRIRNLEATLEKSKVTHKALKSELEALQSGSVTKTAHEKVLAELSDAQKAIDTESKRSSAVDADFKKAQETIKQLNARTNEADKAQKDRRFALENELSKARGELAILKNRPNDSASLQQEIERLRESVAVSTRYAGEMRKREAAAVEALEKAEGRIASGGGNAAQPVVSRKIGPVAESSRIAAAKAEVIRLVELNKQKDSELPVAEVTPVVSFVFPKSEVVAPPVEPSESSFEEVVSMVAESEEVTPAVDLIVAETAIEEVFEDAPLRHHDEIVLVADRV